MRGRVQEFLDARRCFVLLERELRMLVDLAAQCDDLVRQAIGGLR
jgi:hypothetical protein